MHRRTALLLLLAALIVAPWAGPIRPASAAGFTVNSTNDEPDASPGDGICASTPSGACTLRAAIMEANALPGPDSISVPPGMYDLRLRATPQPDTDAANDLDITSEVTITAASAGSTSIRSAGYDFLGPRLLEISPAGNAQISGLTFFGADTFGTGDAGAGIANRGTLTLRDSVIEHNRAGTLGGGLYNSGNALLERVLITSSFAADFPSSPAGYGGGIYNDGTGTLALRNITISGNGVDISGGGIYNNGAMNLTNVTMQDNSASNKYGTASGNSLYNVGSAQVRNSIISRTGGDNCAGSPPESLGNNIESGDTCRLNGPSDRNDLDPRLGPLADNGGPTLTHALLPGSPAIDTAADAACPSTDQRGAPRPRDGNGDGNASCDIGAFEAPAAGDLPPVQCAPRPPIAVQTAPTGDGRLRATISASGANNTVVTLRFARTANAEVDVAGQTGRIGAFSVDLPPGTTRTDVLVRRLVGDQAATVRLVVVDRCGEWPTFFGGGPSAF
jgi:CSLREA domain-containing protein